MDERRRWLMGRLLAAEVGEDGDVTIELSDLERRELVAALWDAEELEPITERRLRAELRRALRDVEKDELAEALDRLGLRGKGRVDLSRRDEFLLWRTYVELVTVDGDVTDPVGGQVSDDDIDSRPIQRAFGEPREIPFEVVRDRVPDFRRAPLPECEAVCVLAGWFGLNSASAASEALRRARQAVREEREERELWGRDCSDVPPLDVEVPGRERVTEFSRGWARRYTDE